MERNVDKIKRLEHELGRWRKKVADTAKENEKLREALAQADVGNQETQALVDAVLTAVVLEHGERAMEPGPGEGAGAEPGIPAGPPGGAAGKGTAAPPGTPRTGRRRQRLRPAQAQAESGGGAG